MKYGFCVLFVQVMFFCVITHVHAATLYMDPNSAELKRGDSMTVAVRLDPGDGECVNAIDGVITYSENIQPVDISRGSSIFSVWVEEPKINKSNRTITFAGGIPNGYCGRIAGDPMLTNNIVNLVFQSPGLQIGSTASGDEATVDFSPETHVYLNDGLGTLAPLTTFSSNIHLTKEAGGTTLNPWKDIVDADNIPPEKFSIALERIPDEHGPYRIVFNTTDKQSGIDHYEVIEEPLSSKNLFGWGAVTAPWVVAKSPYILDDQSLNSTIRVKAIDKAGNEYIATYVPDESKRSISFDNMIIISILALAALVIIGAVVFLFIFIKRRKQRAVQADDSLVIPHD